MFEIFPYVFSNVFNTLTNNSDFIENIVDSVLSSDLVKDMVSSIESMTTLTVEFKEDSLGYTLEANLPGILKKDISLDYNNNYITLEVKRNQIFSNGKNMTVVLVQQEDDLVKDYYVENIDPYKIKAVFKEEFLRVYIPKKRKIDSDATIIDVENYICQ